MCMLTYFPSGAVVDETCLRNGSIINADGHGWAVVDSSLKVIHTGHSMDFESALAAFLDMRGLHPFTDAMFHSRITTHGVTSVDNCHPFRVPGWADTVVGHNGMLPCDPGKDDWRSDTRFFAEEILTRKFPVLDSAKTRRRLSMWMGWSKILVLTVDPRHQHNAYLFGESSGDWVDGVWYSNSGYQPRKSYTWSYKDWSGPRYAQNKDTGQWERVDDGWDDEDFYTLPVSKIDTAESFDDYILRRREERERAEAEAGWESSDALEVGSDGTVSLRSDDTVRTYRGGKETTVIGRLSADTSFVAEQFQCPDAHCRSFNVDVALHLCLACETCTACAEHVTDCPCWDEESEPQYVAGDAATAPLVPLVTRAEAVEGLRAAGFTASDVVVGAAMGLSRAAFVAFVEKLMKVGPLGSRTGWPRAIGAAEAATAAVPGIITSIGVDDDGVSTVKVDAEIGG